MLTNPVKILGNVNLILCGSFNPVTLLHLRMLEVARDHLRDHGYNVHRGLISPVHDSYPKDGLISVEHRKNMLSLALESSSWICLSPWESDQTSWTRTYDVLNYHKGLLKNINESSRSKDVNDRIVETKLVCGSDFFSSFLKPGVWSSADIERILVEFGIVVVIRQGYDLSDLIYQSDILFKYRHRIMFAKEYIENNVSSTKVRTACSRNQSIKYLVDDKVEEYIRKNNLYKANKCGSSGELSSKTPLNLFKSSRKRKMKNSSKIISKSRTKNVSLGERSSIMEVRITRSSELNGKHASK